jgi:lipopolysaccharide transport system permease protein
VISSSEAASATTLIRAHQGWPGWGLAEAWRYRLICFVLAKRDLKVRYRQTAVGAAWTVLQPALLMLAFTLFFGIMARLPTGGLPYAVFFFLGLLPLQLGSKMLSQGSTSVVANSALVSRVYFPRIYLPLAVALETLVDFGFGCIALVALLVIFQIVPTLNVIWAPVFVAVAFTAGLGLSIWLSALNVKYRDIAQMLPFLAQLWMFTSPVIYPSSIVAAGIRNWYFLNPMALAVDGMRWAIGNEKAPPPEEWLIGWTVAIAVLVSGYVFFRRREKTFADLV